MDYFQIKLHEKENNKFWKKWVSPKVALPGLDQDMPITVD